MQKLSGYRSGLNWLTVEGAGMEGLLLRAELAYGRMCRNGGVTGQS